MTFYEEAAAQLKSFTFSEMMQLIAFNLEGYKAMPHKPKKEYWKIRKLMEEKKQND